MHIQIITERYNPEIGGFDTTALEQAQAGMDVRGCETYFFVQDGVQHVSFVLQTVTRDVRPCQNLRTQSSDADVVGAHVPRARHGGKVWLSTDVGDILERIPQECRAAFSALVTWRNETADALKVKRFTVAENKLLERFALLVPQSLGEMEKVWHCGSEFRKKYGESVLEIIRGAPKMPEGFESALLREDEVRARFDHGKGVPRSNASEAAVNSVSSRQSEGEDNQS